MPPDLAEWFAELPPDTPTESPSNDIIADPLVLPWCQEEGPELAGANLHPSLDLPLLCQGCTSLQKNKCQQIARVPTYEQAARCHAFQPRLGVTVGRCWLWRLTLRDGRLVWWSHLPPADQTTALRLTLQRYGMALVAIQPLPGWQEIPNPKDCSWQATCRWDDSSVGKPFGRRMTNGSFSQNPGHAGFEFAYPA